MPDALSRRDFLSVAGSAGTITFAQRHLARLTRVAQSLAGTAPTPTVVRGNARFQILSPTLLRLEYAPSGRFIDAPSVAVIKRDWPVSRHTEHDVNGWLELETPRIRLKYKLGAGAFTADTLVLTWKGPDGERIWKPGDADNGNLGGISDITGQIAFAPPPGPLSRNGYFQLDDSTTAVWNPKTDWPEARPDVEGRQDWFFFVYGRDYAHCLAELAQLLGPIPMVPRYVLGTWFGSRAGYSADEWKRIVRRFEEEEIPLDLLVLDSTTQAAHIWSGYDFDREQMPDPKGFFAWLKARGIKVTVNEHYNAITPQSDSNFHQVRAALGLPRDVKSIEHNIANKEYARLYMDVFHKPALDDGVAFWWQDGMAWGGQDMMPGLDMMLWTRHVEYVGQERLTRKRAFAFCRSTNGVWGGHRYGSVFTGDLKAHWSTLEFLVPYNVGAGAVLLPYVANLAAGHTPQVIDPELYVRWAQFAALSPVFWMHGIWGLRMPWEYGDTVTAKVRDALTLRYALLPYLYTFTRVAHETGLPLARGTYLQYPEQDKVYAFQHQYLLGTDLLVAPVTRAGAGGTALKEVYLPDGDDWHDYFTGTLHPGGQVLAYHCPLERIPLFVRAGAVIPLGPEASSTDVEPTNDPLTIDVYAGDKPTTFRLYEDDGVSLDYRQRAYAWTPITYTPSATGDHRITIGAAEGRFAGQRTSRRYRIRLYGVSAPERVALGAQRLARTRRHDPRQGWAWSARARVLEINLSQPVGTYDATTVNVYGAGTFRDHLAVRYAHVYRERVRRIKIEEKLRWGVLLDMTGQLVEVKKEPHVLQVTNQIEQELNDLIDSPAGAAARPPDFRRMTDMILAALVTRPFDSMRKLPEITPGPAETMAYLADKTFTSEEVRQMTAVLLDARLVATVTPVDDQGEVRNPSLAVEARVLYDAACAAAATAEFELILPDTGLPGWGEMRRSFGDGPSATFEIRPPYQLQPGTYVFTLRATVAWGRHATVLTLSVPWVVSPMP